MLFYLCACWGHSIQTLLMAGADKDIRDENGLTPLLAAVIGDNIESVEVLLEFGAGLEAADK